METSSNNTDKFPLRKHALGHRGLARLGLCQMDARRPGLRTCQFESPFGSTSIEQRTRGQRIVIKYPMLHRGVSCKQPNILRKSTQDSYTICKCNNINIVHMRHAFHQKRLHQGDLPLTIIEPLVSVLLNDATDVMVEA